jgi:hypothetical protein
MHHADDELLAFALPEISFFAGRLDHMVGARGCAHHRSDELQTGQRLVAACCLPARPLT